MTALSYGMFVERVPRCPMHANHKIHEICGRFFVRLLINSHNP